MSAGRKVFQGFMWKSPASYCDNTPISLCPNPIREINYSVYDVLDFFLKIQTLRNGQLNFQGTQALIHEKLECSLNVQGGCVDELMSNIRFGVLSQSILIFRIKRVVNWG